MDGHAHEERVGLPQGEVRYARSGRGTPVVLMHTLRTQLEYLEPLFRALADGPFDVIAVDLPGHGESAAPPADYTASRFVDAMESFLEALDLRGVVLAGDSIGGSIGLLVAARRNPRVRAVVAVNPYDYGTRGGVRRNSLLANVLFSLLLVRGIGAVAARAETAWLIRRVLRSGLHDPSRLPRDLPQAMLRSGRRPGHARAFRSLMLGWRTWIAGRAEYPRIDVPVVLAYGDEDWSTLGERAANARAIPGARQVTLERTGHFAALDSPGEIAALVRDVS